MGLHPCTPVPSARFFQSYIAENQFYANPFITNPFFLETEISFPNENISRNDKI